MLWPVACLPFINNDHLLPNCLSTAYFQSNFFSGIEFEKSVCKIVANLAVLSTIGSRTGKTPSVFSEIRGSTHGYRINPISINKQTLSNRCLHADNSCRNHLPKCGIIIFWPRQARRIPMEYNISNFIWIAMPTYPLNLFGHWGYPNLDFKM